MANLIPTFEQVVRLLGACALFFLVASGLGLWWGVVDRFLDRVASEVDGPVWPPQSALVTLADIGAGLRRAGAALRGAAAWMVAWMIRGIAFIGRVLALVVVRHPLAVLRLVMTTLSAAAVHAAYVSAVIYSDPEDGLVFMCIAFGLLLIGWGVDAIELEPHQWMEW